MPWVNEDLCTGCGVCVENCPSGALQMTPYFKASIDMEECIRCGDCHDICPSEAVRHDSEKIPDRVGDNMATAARLLGKCGSNGAKLEYINKYIKALYLENAVNEKTIEKLESLKQGL